MHIIEETHVQEVGQMVMSMALRERERERERERCTMSGHHEFSSVLDEKFLKWSHTAYFLSVDFI